MANETILIVDDAPVNLKLTDLLLRKEGYKVHATTDAEQALTLLHTTHPDLMLVDIQLPGMNGLDLTRRVKQDVRTRDIVVVALTACAMVGDDDKAFQAGCDGYITKPIETLTLSRKIREYLEHRKAAVVAAAEAAADEPPDAPCGFPSALVLSPAEMEGLRRRFLEDGLAQTRHLLEALEGRLDVEEALRTVHGWVEAARFLDYSELSILAAHVEKLLRAPTRDSMLLFDALSNVMVAFVEPPEAAMGPVPDMVTASLKGKSVALVGCGDDEADRLCGALERASAKPRLFEAKGAPDTEAVSNCDLIVVHVRPETLGTHWLHPLTVSQLRTPLALIGTRDSILELEETVPAAASELLIDGWQPEEALMRFAHAVAHTALAPAPPPAPTNDDGARVAASGLPAMTMPREISRETEVLIADDELTVRMVVRSAIQSAGIKCRMACNGAEALQMVKDCRPTAAILDVNMPGMDGYEVLAAIRNARLPVRVIMLTARQQEADITRAFVLGADDYVVKPFNPAELMARLKRFLWQ